MSKSAGRRTSNGCRSRPPLRGGSPPWPRGGSTIVDKHSCRVFGRFRPLEDGADESPWSIVDGREVEIPTATGLFQCRLDAVFDGETSQQAVYEATSRPLVQDLLDGYNASVFAYGQTGTGKTHSIYGPVDASHEHRGLALRAIEALFRHLGGLEASIGGTKRVAGITDVPPVVRASYVELYNDAFNDLLTPADVVLAEPTAGMDLRSAHAPSGAYVEGLTEVEVATPAEIFELVAAGNARRVVAGTAVNARSSRGHTILCLQLEQRVAGDDGAPCVRTSKLSLIDLAGSERAAATEGLDDERAEEGRKINLSLTSLGLCVQKLTTAAKGTAVHVPYRNSKLTQLLQDSLGGNTKTVMLFGLSRAASRLDETINTLRFAMRAKKLQTTARVVDAQALRAAAAAAPSAAPSRRPSHACATALPLQSGRAYSGIGSSRSNGAAAPAAAGDGWGSTMLREQHYSLSLREEQLAAREMRIAAEEATAALRAELEAEKRDGAARERALCAALAEMEAALGESERARRKALKKLKKLEGAADETTTAAALPTAASPTSSVRAASPISLARRRRRRAEAILGREIGRAAAVQG